MNPNRPAASPAPSRRTDGARPGPQVPERGRYLSVAVAVGFVLVATLIPTGSGAAGAWTACIFCGTRATADTLLNIVLFVPIGAAAARLTSSARLPLLLGAALSASVELLQMGVPGRDPSLGDLLFNTLGVGLGTVLVCTARGWMLPPPSRAAALSLAAAAAAALVIAATGYLLRPDFPASAYFGQWTPDLGHLERYAGRVVEAEIGGLPLPSHRLEDPERARRLLRGAAALRIRALAGPPPPALAPIFSIHDNAEREVVLLGADGEDLVLRLRTRASAARLDQPDLRIGGALAGLAPGDPVEIRTWGGRRGRCIQLRVRAHCGLGFTAADGWMLLLFWEDFPPWVQRLLSGAWIFLLLLPFGLWARRRPASPAGAVVLLLALAALPGRVGLVPLPAGALAGAGLGVLAGVLLRRALERGTGRPRPRSV